MTATTSSRLLHEHHDFFQAPQHPSANSHLSTQCLHGCGAKESTYLFLSARTPQLLFKFSAFISIPAPDTHATRYSMPFRMWRRETHMLHEHHDFFVSSQRPFSSKAISRLIPKSLMPARIWRHGFHGLLVVDIPGPEYMLAFTHVASLMMALAGTESLRLERSNK